MKALEGFRDPKRLEMLLHALQREVTQEHTLMEICGGQTHAILKHGLLSLLPPQIRLIHGPGCPVCVTPLEQIEKALLIASRPDVIFCSFGDMLRVPGLQRDLFSVKATGADIRVLYSPLDAVKIAEQSPQKKVVFFSVGFETTAPATALAVALAAQKGLQNFFLLVSHVLVPPAIRALLHAPDNQIQGFLAAGHVCTIMGYAEYEQIAQEEKIPIVITGFEPLDIVQGILSCVRQREAKQAFVENAYARAVQRDGNPHAKRQVEAIFSVIDRRWRGIGLIPQSGLALHPDYAAFDAELHFGLQDLSVEESADCRSGEVLRGVLSPPACPSFGRACTPEHPLGAPMVSSEGACAAYYHYANAQK
jgi:hydrogenase expression/formation protein HypD